MGNRSKEGSRNSSQYLAGWNVGKLDDDLAAGKKAMEENINHIKVEERH